MLCFALFFVLAFVIDSIASFVVDVAKGSNYRPLFHVSYGATVIDEEMTYQNEAKRMT